MPKLVNDYGAGSNISMDSKDPKLVGEPNEAE